MRLVLLGPSGSGKSVQGRKLQDDLGWKWLSLGELFRQAKDPELEKTMGSGALVDTDVSNRMMEAAIRTAESSGRSIVIDGYPREVGQALSLAEADLLPDLVVILSVPRAELLRRLKERGRADDTDEAVVQTRLAVFYSGIAEIREFFSSRGVRVLEIDGDKSVEEVHKAIMHPMI